MEQLCLVGCLHEIDWVRMIGVAASKTINRQGCVAFGLCISNIVGCGGLGILFEAIEVLVIITIAVDEKLKGLGCACNSIYWCAVLTMKRLDPRNRIVDDWLSEELDDVLGVGEILRKVLCYTIDGSSEELEI